MQHLSILSLWMNVTGRKKVKRREACRKMENFIVYVLIIKIIPIE
jgi:hypothetical protein